jgi:DnaJ-class molecular chaperone
VRLRQRYHPERNADDPLARDIVRYLDSAYATLIDPERRQAYDAILLNGASTTGMRLSPE